MTLPHPFQGQLVIGRLRHAMVNLPTKFEVYNFSHYQDMKNVKNAQIGVVWGNLGPPKVIGNVTVPYSAYDFLFAFNRNYASIFYCFTVRHYASSALAVVCLSVCVSQTSIVSKRLQMGSRKQCHTIAQEL